MITILLCVILLTVVLNTIVNFFILKIQVNSQEKIKELLTHIKKIGEFYEY